MGAGPGDAGLMTMRGAQLLGQAQIVLYDALVNPLLLQLAPVKSELIYSGKRSKAHAFSQDEINRLLIEKAKAGKKVVRLKGGDPYVFGRGGEEAEALREAGVAFEVVPGVSSILAVPNYAGIPITHREICSAFTVATGHENPNKSSANIDWKTFSKLDGTKLILMGVEQIESIMNRMKDHGLAADTPVAIIRWGTTGRQETLIGTISDIAQKAKCQGFSAPAITIIGEVVSLRDRLNWFEERPLFGNRIVVTRSRQQASRLSQKLMEWGADVLEIPTLRIAPPSKKQFLIDAMSALGEYDWIIFTSPNGVESFFDYFFRAFDDLRDLGNLRIAAVGSATASKVESLHLRVDVVPKKYVATEIAKAMAAFENVENLKLLLVRAEIANPDLPKALTQLGAIVDDVPVYQTLIEENDFNGAADRLTNEGADWVIFTSSSTVVHFDRRFDLDKLCEKLPKLKLASIGPETSKALRSLKKEPTLEAAEHTIDGLVKSLIHHSKKDGR